MGIFKRTTGFIGRRFNVKRWIGYDEHKRSMAYLARSAKQLFRSSKLSAEQNETFDEAVKRLGLTEADIQARYRACNNAFNFFIIVALGAPAYTLYLLFITQLMGALLAGAVVLLVGIQAFKYHFWMFQIKNHKLGCTFDEWRQNRVNNNKNKADSK